MSPVAVKEGPRTMSPVERLESLCDPGSFAAVRTAVRSARLGDRSGPGDGVVAGAGRVGGRPIFCYAQDAAVMGGSLGAAHADSIVRVLELAGQSGVPVVGFVESGGARLQEGHAALAGYGRIFRASVELSAKVPQVTVVGGVAAGGGAYSPALTDFVVMTESARMFLTGPKIVEAALGEQVSMEDLGGPPVHSTNGVCQLVAADDRDAARLARRLLALLPSRFGGQAPIAPAGAPGAEDPSLVVPAEARKVYDVREVAEAVADEDSLLELSPAWARNMVTALARIEGRPVAFIANQPRRFGGVIDTAAAEKAALFVDACNRFGIPLVVLVDTPGFMPGSGQERAGVIRHGASLLRVVRRGDGAEGDRRPAQGLRRRRDHDELPRPGRRHGLRLALRRGRDHGRPPGGGHRPPAAAGRGERRRRRSADRARVRLRGRAPERRRGRRGGVRRRGHRADGDAGAPGVGAARPGGTVSRDPFALIAETITSQQRRPEARGAQLSLYAALGDSFTAGTGCRPGEAWPERLAAGLRVHNPTLAFRNLAVEGATSEQVLEQLPEAIELEPDLITVVCGANDVLRTTRPDAGTYARRLAAIFGRLQRANPAVRLVTATSPERWDFLELGPRTRDRVERGIARANRATRIVADAYAVPYLEVAGHPGLCEPENFSADGLHPSPLGHRRAARGFAELIRDRFRIPISIEGGTR